MRKKIAAFAGGWSGEYLQEVLGGIKEEAGKRDTDVFAFVNFTLDSSLPIINTAEENLFHLPDLCDFDGIVLLTNSFHTENERNYLLGEIGKCNIPTVSIEYKFEGIPFIGTDNYTGMYDLANHLFEVHNIKSAVFIGGPKEHPECQERLLALMNAAKENGVDIPDKNILYADWGKVLIPEILDKWLLENDNLMPEAFVCANDIMAIAVCDYMKTKGKNVPADVVVTGYDCLRLSQTYTVPITTVNHNWKQMGAKAAKTLFEVIDGKSTKKEHVLKTFFRKSSSCGCKDNYGNYCECEPFGRNLNIIDPINVDAHFRRFYSDVRKIKNRIDLTHSYSYLFEQNHLIEGDYFKICVDPEFFNVSKEQKNLLEHGHRDEYEIICSIEGGKVAPTKRVTKKEALFAASKINPNPDLYMFMALYSETYTYGFIMMSSSTSYANENQCYIWTRHMNQAFEQIHNNLIIEDMHKKLMQLSVLDALTGAYNRNGCESVIYPKLIEWGKQGKTSAVMIVDVDHLKIINDKFGHIYGDQAIRLVTKAIKKALPEGFEVSRFGGDEFFVGGILQDPAMDLDALLDTFEKTLKDITISEKVEYPLTMSIGYSKITATSIGDIEKGIVQADIWMYKHKEVHHKLY